MAIDLDKLISQCLNKQLLTISEIKEIAEKAKELLIDESNVVQVKAPCVVVGDVHGQFFDVLEIFKIAGNCPDTNYVFLGDYVDRGLYSVEVMSLLLCLKVRYPARVILVRGNHESRGVTATYGFYTECVKKYGTTDVWTIFTDLFDYLVLAVEIDNTILCVHGGLSPSIHMVDQIKAIDRFKEIPHEGPMADLVWSDPVPNTADATALFSVSPRGSLS
jgi:serine/threonine-protein phosphatase PPG1